MLDTRDYNFPDNPTSQQVRTWTQQEKFLTEYAICGGIYTSADATGVSYNGYRVWLDGDKFMFQKRMEEAKSRYLEKMVREVDRRALKGVDQDIFYQRDKIGTKTVYSDNLLMFSVKQRDPSYRDTTIINVDVSALEELVRGLRGRQLEDSKALPPADTIIEHVSKDDVPPWSERNK